jgi:protein TonB
MLFTESPAAPPASRPVTPAASNTKSSPTGNAGSAPGNSGQKAPEVKSLDAKPAPRPLPKPVPAAKSKAYDIEQVEEVKVPDWLAPLSRNVESTPVAAPAPPASAASEQSRIPGWLAPLSHIAPPAPADVVAVPAGPGESTASHVLPAVESEARSDDAPFGGKMLDESLEPVEEASSAGSSKKGLFLGLAAAALLLAGGGVWYMRQTRGGNSGSSPTKAVEAPVSSPTVAVNNPAVVKPEATAPPTGPNSSSTTFSPVSGEPAKNAAPAVSPLPATVPKNSPPLTRSEPAAEQPKKPSLGEVRLSAPVVSRAKNSPQSGDAAPSLGTSMPTAGAESLSSLSANAKEPVAPVEVGGNVKAARLVKSVPPVYPAVARSQRIAGNVSIDAVVGTDGNVSTMKVLSGPAILHRAALDAVKQWHYEPAVLDGKPTASHLTVIVQFRLQ